MDAATSPEVPQLHHDVYKASTVAEIQASLAQLNRQEASVTARLNTLIASQKDLSRELGRLDLLRANLGSQVIIARAISNGVLSDAATTANRISSAVKKLDLEQSNVKATLDVVEQVAELKACVLGVHGSMGAPQDWETAAGYLHRASNISPEVIDSSFAEEIVPTAEVPDPPRVTLNNAAESLCGLFLREFEKAAKENDGSKVTRFFKLFPLIGRTEVGLDAYGRYVCHGVASRARTDFNSASKAERSEALFYATALTKLFEHIAQIVEGHEPLVERHYGTGMMPKVIERLQVEADVQGGIILDTWYDERTIDRKLTDIKSYAFSFLVQSFLPQPKPSTNLPRSSSPANAGVGGRDSEDESIDMKEVDGLLSEIALMLGRWALYTRFLASKCAPPVPEDFDGNDPLPLEMPQFLAESNLQKKMSKSLVEPFNIMTTFYFRRSVEKAFQIDEQPADLTLQPNKPLGANPPFITSAVDDIMYIVNQVIQRSLATSQRTVVGNALQAIGRVLSSDFIGMIQRKMRDECYPKPVIQGALPPEDKVIGFLVLANNLDVATNYLNRIINTHLGSADKASDDTTLANPTTPPAKLTDLFPFNNDAQIVMNALKTLGHTFEAKTTELLHDAISVAFNQIIKPRIRPILAETFRDVDYASSPSDNNTGLASGAIGDDDALTTTADADTPDELVKTRFDRGWGALMRPLKRILTARNFDRLLAQSTAHLARALEKRLWSHHQHGRVSALGAVRLERDVAGLVAAAVAGGRYALRDAFARCLQIALVVNMEEDEWEEVLRLERDGGGHGDGVAEHDAGIVWVLDREERARARAMVRERERERV